MFGKNVNAEDFNNIDMGTFEEKYSEKGLWEKIQGNVAAIGANGVGHFFGHTALWQDVYIFPAAGRHRSELCEQLVIGLTFKADRMGKIYEISAFVAD